jgi:outer membrane protein assembly factor BamB
LIKRLKNIISAILIITGMGALGWWLTANPTGDFTVGLPGMDNRVSPGDSIAEEVIIGANFEEFSGRAPELKEKWPRFRGADFDNISKSEVRLIGKFGPEDPKIRWSVDLGEGHAGPALYEGKVYLLDYDEELRADMLRCFSLIDGTELWRRWYHVNVKRNHGMSRTVPAVTEDYILTIGPRAHVMCVKRSNGDFLWGLDVEKEYETEIPFWYTGQCPFIDQDKAIIATGGKALLIAIDCATGELLWETPNEEGWKMSHSSIMPFYFGGRKMYVYSAVGGVCGIAADGNDEGQLLWSTSAWQHPVVAPSPVCMPDGKIFLTAGYGAGSMVLQLTGADDEFNIQVLQEYVPKDGLACEQQTPIYYMGHLFGILPKDAAEYRNQFVCVDPVDCQSFVWTSGKENRFGMGPYILADNKFFILSDDATLTIAEPSTSSYIQLDQIKVFEGQDAWAPLAVADGYMLLRDSKKMVCIDIRTPGSRD